jgi:hypothetical protein
MRFANVMRVPSPQESHCSKKPPKLSGCLGTRSHRHRRIFSNLLQRWVGNLLFLFSKRRYSEKLDVKNDELLSKAKLKKNLPRKAIRRNETEMNQTHGL